MHPYVLASIQPIIDLCRQHNIIIESYGPLTSLIRHPGGPVDESIMRVAARMAKGPETRTVTEGQVLIKWAQQRTDGIVITFVGPIFGDKKTSLLVIWSCLELLPSLTDYSSKRLP